MNGAKVFFISLVTGGLAAAGVVYGAFQVTTAQVPDVKLKGEEAARAVSEAAELGFVVVHEKPSALVPLGSVISQVPKAATRVPKGTAVLATVSLGPEDRIPAIDLPEIPQPGKKKAEEPPADAKKVAEAGQAAKKAAEAEREEVAVPKLYRKRLSTAKQLLERDGLKLGPVTKAFDENLPFNIIFRQDPRPGQMARVGTEVAVTLNTELDDFQ